MNKYQIKISVHALAQIAENYNVSPNPYPQYPDTGRIQRELCDPELNGWVTPWIMNQLNALNYEIVWLGECDWPETKQPWIQLTFKNQADWAWLMIHHVVDFDHWEEG